MKTGKVVKSVGGVFHVFSEGKKLRLFSRKKSGCPTKCLWATTWFSTKAKDDRKSFAPNQPPVETARRKRGLRACVCRAKSRARPSACGQNSVKLLQTGNSAVDSFKQTGYFRRGFLQPHNGKLCRSRNGFCISALTGDGVEALKSSISGKTVCFAGQSAVGKTTLLNLLAGEKCQPTACRKNFAREKHDETQRNFLRGTKFLFD